MMEVCRALLAVSALAVGGAIYSPLHIPHLFYQCVKTSLTLSYKLCVLLFYVDKYSFIIHILINQSVVAWNDAAAV